MVSTKPVAEFSRVLDGIVPLTISDFIKEDFIETVLRTTCPVGIKEESYKGIVKNVYSVAKDQIGDASSLAAYVGRILPSIQKIAESRNSAKSCHCSSFSWIGRGCKIVPCGVETNDCPR